MQQAKLFELGGLVAGVDEAGRGPLAGPVVAAAVIALTITSMVLRIPKSCQPASETS
jgi:ribonuclease HII